MPASGLLGGHTDRTRVNRMVGFGPAEAMAVEAQRILDA